MAHHCRRRMSGLAARLRRSPALQHGPIMELLVDLAAWSLLLFALVLFLCQLLAHWLGYLLGRRRQAMRGTSDADAVGLVVNSLLGLLAFTLALTLSYGSARFAERRAGVLAEAKAIGTAWLRAEAIGHPLGHEIADLLKQYGTLRRDFVAAPYGAPAIEEIDRKSADLQLRMWERVSSIVRERSDDVASALMVSVNETFDAGAAERFALETKFPYQLACLLAGMALLAMGSFGYQLGLNGHIMPVLVAILIAVWTAMLVVILDMGAPRLGTMRTNTAVYDWTLEGMSRRSSPSASVTH